MLFNSNFYPLGVKILQICQNGEQLLMLLIHDKFIFQKVLFSELYIRKHDTLV